MPRTEKCQYPPLGDLRGSRLSRGWIVTPQKPFAQQHADQSTVGHPVVISHTGVITAVIYRVQMAEMARRARNRPIETADSFPRKQNSRAKYPLPRFAKAAQRFDPRPHDEIARHVRKPVRVRAISVPRSTPRQAFRYRACPSRVKDLRGIVRMHFIPHPHDSLKYIELSQGHVTPREISGKRRSDRGYTRHESTTRRHVIRISRAVQRGEVFFLPPCFPLEKQQVENPHDEHQDARNREQWP